MAINASVGLKLNIKENSAANVFSDVWWEGLFEYQKEFTDGVGADQANRVVMLERTVASGANDDIDIYGSISYPVHGTINAAEIVGFIVANRPVDPNAASNTTNLVIGGGSNNATNAFITGTTKTIGPIRPGGFVMFFNPDASGIGVVTSGTADIMRIANSAGASATYVVILLLRTN